MCLRSVPEIAFLVEHIFLVGCKSGSANYKQVALVGALSSDLLCFEIGLRESLYRTSGIEDNPSSWIINSVASDGAGGM